MLRSEKKENERHLYMQGLRKEKRNSLNDQDGAWAYYVHINGRVRKVIQRNELRVLGWRELSCFIFHLGHKDMVTSTFQKPFLFSSLES